jgi:fatty acid desaturase
MVVGGRRLGLAILMHDAPHGLLFANRRLNDGVGMWLCAWAVFTSLALYRPYHLQHHRFTQHAEDPDLGLSAPFPISRASLRRKIVRDLTGQTAFQRRGEQIRRALGPADASLAERLNWVNYHLEHHLFMFVPCWRLPAAHRALLAAGRKDDMELQPRYLAVLRLAASRVGGSTGRSGSRGTAQHI